MTRQTRQLYFPQKSYSSPRLISTIICSEDSKIALCQFESKLPSEIIGSFFAVMKAMVSTIKYNQATNNLIFCMIF